MSIFRRLGNVARGKVLSWQRTRSEPVDPDIEAELEHRAPRAPDDVPEEEPIPVAEKPTTPRKRRL